MLLAESMDFGSAVDVVAFVADAIETRVDVDVVYSLAVADFLEGKPGRGMRKDADVGRSGPRRWINGREDDDQTNDDAHRKPLNIHFGHFSFFFFNSAIFFQF